MLRGRYGSSQLYETICFSSSLKHAALCQNLASFSVKWDGVSFSLQANCSRIQINSAEIVTKSELVRKDGQDKKIKNKGKTITEEMGANVEMI